MLFLHTFDSSRESSAPKLTNFQIFIIPLPLNVTLFSKSLYLTAHLKINYETGAPEGFLKKQRGIHRTITTSKVELVVALFSGFQLIPQRTPS